MKYADMFSKVKGMFMTADVSDITEHSHISLTSRGKRKEFFMWK